MASRGAPRNETDTDEWEKDAAFYIESFEGIKSIAWVDETLRVRRIVPLQDNLSYMDQTANEIIWDPSDVNLWMACNDGIRFNGYILGIIDISEIISPVVGEINNDYMLKLSNEEITVFTSENWNQHEEGFTFSRRINLQDTAVLNLSFAPTDELINSEIINARKTLIFCLLFSFITIISVYFAQNFNAIALFSEFRYRNLFESSQDALFIINLQGEYQDANKAATSMVGYSLAELQQMNVSDLRVLSETLPSQEQPRVLREVGSAQMYLRHKDGHEIPVDLVISPVKEGEVQKYVLGIARDITERVQAEEKIKAYSEKLEEMVAERTRKLQDAQEKLLRQERLAVIGEMAGSVSHELRNPLGVISNAVYFLQNVIPLSDEKINEYLQIIDRETKNASGIISDLLEYTRVQQGERQDVPVSRLVREVFERHLAPVNVTLALDIPDGLPPAFVDPRQIGQVLDNLVMNAYQAMPDGGKLTFSVNNAQDEIEMTISDTGSGIPPENIDKIFEPLFTSKARGIGLGLAISKRLVEANSGKVTVVSEGIPGKGSTFTLTFPIER